MNLTTLDIERLKQSEGKEYYIKSKCEKQKGRLSSTESLVRNLQINTNYKQPTAYKNKQSPQKYTIT